MKRFGALLLCGLMAVAAASARAADLWGDIATISPTSPLQANRLCYTDGLDIACNGTAPYLTSGGLLGIGTANPMGALHINSTGTDEAIVIGGGTPGSTQRDNSITFTEPNNGAGDNGIRWLDGSGNFLFGIYGSASLGAYGAVQASVPFYFDVNNIGVGDMTPDAAFEISEEGTTPFMISNGDDGDGDLMIVTTAGNVGIGTTNPDALLELSAPGAVNSFLRLSGEGNQEVRIVFSDQGIDEWQIERSDSRNALDFTESGVAKHMTIASGGNVGIGTTSPNAKLEVNGTISATNLVVNGQSITGGADRIVSGSVSAIAQQDTDAVQVSGSVNVSGMVMAGDGSCVSNFGSVRINPATGRLQMCLERP